MTIDHFVQAAIAEHETYRRLALPSLDKVEPRIMVHDGARCYLRRPIHKGGHWYVKLAGTARLVNAFVADGWIRFNVTHNW